MIVAGWKEVGVLAGKLFALEPPFVQICIALTAAFAFLMVVEGLRASFTRREATARKTSAAARESESQTYRSTQASPAARNSRLRDNAIKTHSAPRPRIQRKLVSEAAPSDTAGLPQVASFEE